MAVYISLFCFGAGSRQGGHYRSLCRSGHEDLFVPSREAFERWLDFVLDPRNADLLKSGFGTAAHEEMGFLSYRLLHLCVPNALHRMQKKRFQQPDQIRQLFGKHLYDDYVRLEHLSADLFAFLSRHSSRLRLQRPLTTADELMARIPVRNASSKIEGLRPETVAAELRQRVRDREWLLYEAFGYDTDPKGRPPNCVSGLKAETNFRVSSSDMLRRQRRRERRAAR